MLQSFVALYGITAALLTIDHIVATPAIYTNIAEGGTHIWICPSLVTILSTFQNTPVIFYYKTLVMQISAMFTTVVII